MIRNYFTLYHAAMELHEMLVGSHLTDICSQHKNEVILSFKGIDGRDLQVFVVTRIPQLCLYTKEGVHRKARNAASLMSEVYNQKVTSVTIAPSDREILILLADESIIVLQLFTSRTNVFLVRENRIIDAFKHNNSLAGEPYQPGNDSPGILKKLEALAMNKTLFLEQCNARSEEEIIDNLTAGLPGFDLTLSQAILKRAAKEEYPESLFIAFQSVFYELLDPKAAVSEHEDGRPTFSLMQSSIRHARLFDSVLAGLTDYSISMRRFLETKERLKALRSKLLREIAKKQKTLEGFDPDLLVKFAEHYETSGHLLMASLYQQRTDRQSITVKNIFEPDAPEITIKLKEALTLQKNAEEYFSKASKTRGKLKAMQARHAVIEREKLSIEELLAATETIVSPKEAKKFIESHADLLGKMVALPSKNNHSALPFRVLQLSPSATLLVGRNAANNDLLTFSHARPNDIWLHARGAAGSHCVLKGVSLHQLNDIKKAAEVAAWFSSAKHSELVPVLYTLKKYVRHGKNLAPGQVIVEREEVILVKPSQGSE